MIKVYDCTRVCNGRVQVRQMNGAWFDESIVLETAGV